MKRLTITHLMLAAAVVAAGGTASRLRAAAGGTVALAVPGRSSANPSIASQGALVVVTWSATTPAGATDIYASASHDAGRTFGNPVRVNDVPGDAKVSGEQPPRISLVPRKGAEPSLVVVWTAAGKSGGGTRLLSARSDDGGKSFARAAEVPGSEAAGNRGWESTATDRDGHVLAIWLDHRETVPAAGAKMAMPMHHDAATPTPPDQATHTGHEAGDGVAKAQLSKLYVGRLDGTGGAHAIAGGVCYCCKTALAASADGSVYAAWRHVYPGNVRDIAFTVSRDGGQTFAAPIRVSEDGWVLDGCPENGPAMVADGRTVHVVWPTLVAGGPAGASAPEASREPTLALYYAATSDGRRFSARQLIPTQGVPRHVQIARASDAALVIAWDEQANGTRRVAVAQGRPGPSSSIQFGRRETVGAERGEYPALAAMDDGVVMAWTSGAPAQSVIRLDHLGRH